MGPDLFDFIFGGEWREAGVFARLLAPYFLVTFIKDIIGFLYSSLERQRMSFILSVVGLAVNISLLYSFGKWEIDVFWILAAYSLVNILLNLWLILYILQVIRADFGDYLKRLSPLVTLNLGMSVLLLIPVLLLENSLLIAIILAALLYALYGWFFVYMDFKIIQRNITE